MYRFAANPDLEEGLVRLDDLSRRLDAAGPILDALRTHGENRRRTTTLLLGRYLVACKRYHEAEEALNEFLEYEDRADPDSMTAIIARSALGAALAGQGRFDEAEPLLLGSYGAFFPHGGIPTVYGFYKPLMLRRIVELYDRWEKPGTAAEWRAKA